MITAIEAHYRGLEEGKGIALLMLNAALDIQAENIGQAINPVMVLRNQLAKAKQDYESMKFDNQPSYADWK